MKKLFTLLFTFINAVVFCQAPGGVSITTNGGQADPSAALDVNFNNKGFLMPRLSTVQRDSIFSPATGLFIFNTDCNVVNYNAGTPESPNWATMVASNTLTAGVSIAANPTGAICSGTSVTFTATPTNGGASPNYQWKVNSSNAGANSSTYSYTPANGDVIACVMTPNNICVPNTPVTSGNITMAVTPNDTLSLSIHANPSGAIISGTSVTFTASAVNGGTAPSYQWILNGANVGSNDSVYSNTTLNNGDNISCILTSSGPCLTGSPDTSNTISMTVVNYEIFTSNGTFTPVNGVTSYKVLVVGGGGNGGVAQYQNGGGGGGGSGTVVVGTYTITNPVTVTIGGADNSTTFGTFVSTAGGSDGDPGGNSSCPIHGGTGGSGGGAGTRCGDNGGGDGGSGGGNGNNPPCGGCCGSGGTGQGSYTSSLSLFTQATITAGTGGSGDTYGSCNNNNLMNGEGGSGYGAGGGGGSDDYAANNAHGGGGGGGGILINGAGPSGGTGNAYTNGGGGGSGVVYIEW